MPHRAIGLAGLTAKVGGKLRVAATAACDVYDVAAAPSGPRQRTMVGSRILQMRTWLEGLFRKGPLSTMDEVSLESRAEISPEERAVLLVGILDDPTAREDEKFDAAMDLEDFSGPVVETCLIRIIRAEDFTSVLAQHCAESLGGIWARTGRVDPAFMAQLRGPAKSEVFGILGIRAPHLLPPNAL